MSKEGLKLYKRGDIWHYRGTVSGRLLRGTTKTSDETKARRILAETEAAAWKEKLDGPPVLTFAGATNLYELAGKRDANLENVSGYWKDTPVPAITPQMVRAAAIKLFPTHMGSTRNRKFVAVTQSVINHAAKQGLCARWSAPRFDRTGGIADKA